LNKPPAATSTDEHQLTWADRLQDWVDGDLTAADRSSVESHLSDCEICQAQLVELERLDRALTASAPRLSLDAAFDERLLRQIDTVDDSRRALARQRFEQEMRENLQALSRRWRRSLAFVVPGVIAGIALAFALAGWFDSSDLSRALVVEGANEFGRQTASYLQALSTALIGAGIGFAVARWLSSAAD
jgi:anti-sigma factor RsiW